MEELLQFDQNLFHLINSEWHHSFLDTIMPIWRHKLFWFPFYLFLITFSILNFKLKGLYFIIALLITVGFADIMSSHLVKKSVQRIRPCNDAELKDDVKLLVRCGSGYSFTSSHASNHFAIAGFLILTIARKQFWLKLMFFFWAASIAYGQVYVGVHYPLDILCGGLIGYLIGWGMGTIYKRMEGIRIEAFYMLPSNYIN